MKKNLALLVLLSFISGAFAATPLPPDLVGIWGSTNSKFKGEALVQGSAIYLDSDGIGSAIAGNGRDVLGCRVVVTGYDPEKGVLTFDYTEQGKVLFSATMIYDSTRKVLFSPTNSEESYERYADTISVNLRQSLGLEKREDKALAPITVRPNNTEFRIPFYRIRNMEFK